MTNNKNIHVGGARSKPVLVRLGLLDATFLRIETSATPTHVAALQVFSRPAGAPADFIRRVVQDLRATRPLVAPWNRKLVSAPFSSLVPAMAELESIDMEYHVRHTALPQPSGERELGELISHLHGQLLDRSRPLWTCHVIEGLENDRFAIYIKIHHALTDGVNGVRLVTRCLASDPDGAWSGPWHHQPAERPQRVASEAPAPGMRLGDWRKVCGAIFTLMRQDRVVGEPIRRPFDAPYSVLNGPVTAARRVATQQLDLARIRHVAKQTGGSVNDVFLALCSGALRRHMLSSGSLPEQALIAGVPVSLREPDDKRGGNAIGFLWATLATDRAGARERLAAIQASMQVAKDHLKTLSLPARACFTMLTMLPVIGVLLSGLGARLRPPMNVTISNVPGPDQVLYLNGARLEALYPVSVPLQGQGLNISCVTYAGRFNVGFTGGRDSLPSLQRVAVYTGEALEELEATLDQDSSSQVGMAGRG